MKTLLQLKSVHLNKSSFRLVCGHKGTKKNQDNTHYLIEKLHLCSRNQLDEETMKKQLFLLLTLLISLVSMAQQQLTVGNVTMTISPEKGAKILRPSSNWSVKVPMPPSSPTSNSAGVSAGICCPSKAMPSLHQSWWRPSRNIYANKVLQNRPNTSPGTQIF